MMIQDTKQLETYPPLQDLTTQIVTLVHPLQIILFGSTARNESKVNSDLDLLIVMPDGTHRRQTAQKIYRYVSGIVQPFDIIVATIDDLNRHKDNIGLIYHTILNEGISIYNAA